MGACLGIWVDPEGDNSNFLARLIHEINLFRQLSVFAFVSMCCDCGAPGTLTLQLIIPFLLWISLLHLLPTDASLDDGECSLCDLGRISRDDIYCVVI